MTINSQLKGSDTSDWMDRIGVLTNIQTEFWSTTNLDQSCFDAPQLFPGALYRVYSEHMHTMHPLNPIQHMLLTFIGHNIYDQPNLSKPPNTPIHTCNCVSFF